MALKSRTLWIELPNASRVNGKKSINNPQHGAIVHSVVTLCFCFAVPFFHFSVFFFVVTSFLLICLFAAVHRYARPHLSVVVFRLDLFRVVFLLWTFCILSLLKFLCWFCLCGSFTALQLFC